MDEDLKRNTWNHHVFRFDSSKCKGDHSRTIRLKKIERNGETKSSGSKWKSIKANTPAQVHACTKSLLGTICVHAMLPLRLIWETNTCMCVKVSECVQVKQHKRPNLSHHHPSGARCARPWKRSLNTAADSLSSGGFSSELHPQWWEGRAASCHEADPGGLVFVEQTWGGDSLRRMRACAWMFLPFLEEAHCLWHGSSRSIRSCKRSEGVGTSFVSRPLWMFEWATIVTVGNKFSDLTAALGRSCQFPQSCPQMRSSTPLSHRA